MRKRLIVAGLSAVALAAGGVAVLMPGAFATAQPAAADPSVGEPIPSDDLPSEDGVKLRELREEAVQAVLTGRATPQKINGSTVVKLGSSDQARSRGASLFRHKDRYVELEREKTDRIFVVLVEFGRLP